MHCFLLSDLLQMNYKIVQHFLILLADHPASYYCLEIGLIIIYLSYCNLILGNSRYI